MRFSNFIPFVAVFLCAQSLRGINARPTEDVVSDADVPQDSVDVVDPANPVDPVSRINIGGAGSKRPPSPGAADGARPAPGRSGSGAAGTAGGTVRPRPGAAISAGSPAGYTRPTSYARGDVNFVNRGEALTVRMRTPPNAADIGRDSKQTLDSRYDFDVKSNVDNVRDFSDTIGPAFQKFRITAKDWRDVDVTYRSENMEVSMTSYSKSDKMLLVHYSNNQGLRDVDVAGIARQSDIWHAGHSNDIADVKYVVRSSIINKDTIAIIKDARAKLVPGLADGQAVVLRADASSIAEKEAFAALAGSDNGSTVFRMITDKHNYFHDRKVVAVHVWGAERGQRTKNELMRPNAVDDDKSGVRTPLMVWELS